MYRLIQVFSGFMMDIGASLDIGVQTLGKSDQAETRVRQCLARIREVGADQAFIDFNQAQYKDCLDQTCCLVVYDLLNQCLIYSSMQHRAASDYVEGDLRETLSLRTMLLQVQSQGSGWIAPARSGLSATYVEIMDQYCVACRTLQ